jgi:hypothetical protein
MLDGLAATVANDVGVRTSRYAGPIVLTVGAYLAVTHLALQFVFMKHSDPADAG